MCAVIEERATGLKQSKARPLGFADGTVALLLYHRDHPEVRNYRLADLFAITDQRVGAILKRDKRDQSVISYFQAHPEARLAEVRGKFHVTEERARVLYIAAHPVLLAVGSAGGNRGIQGVGSSPWKGEPPSRALPLA